MLIDLQAHYLDLIVQALDEAGHGALLVKSAANVGAIYVTATPDATKSVAVLTFNFQDTSASLGVQFRDGRKPVIVQVAYHDGLDEFFAQFLRALKGNRIEHKRAA